MDIDPIQYTTRPESCTQVESKIYDKLEALNISYTRVSHDHADTIEDCHLVEEILGAKICKNLFLCNRKATEFYLLMMPGDKVFKTKNLSPLLGCTRLSFAGEAHMAELLQTIPGSVSGLELLFDTEHKIQLVIDSPLLDDEFISGHPGLSSSTLRILRQDMLEYLKAVGHEPVIITLPDISAED